MRPIHLAHVGGKSRPVLVLTREISRPYMTSITVAPITSRIRGLSVEIPVGPHNGLDLDSVVNCDNIATIAASDLGRQVGWLYTEQEQALSDAIGAAFDLL